MCFYACLCVTNWDFLWQELVGEIALSERAYFDVYTRDCLRHQRVFGMTAVELWRASNFKTTRDFYHVFKGGVFDKKAMSEKSVFCFLL